MPTLYPSLRVSYFVSHLHRKFYRANKLIFCIWGHFLFDFIKQKTGLSRVTPSTAASFLRNADRALTIPCPKVFQPFLTHPHQQEASLRYEDFQKLAQKLADFEDKQEQGLLIDAPVKPEDTVYVIVKKDISPQKVIEIHMSRNGIEIMTNRRVFHISAFGETVFLTRSEAEEALEKKGGK